MKAESDLLHLDSDNRVKSLRFKMPHKHEENLWRFRFEDNALNTMLHRMLFSYCYHPVGQGQFFSGKVSRLSDYPSDEFTWVYDCGSVSNSGGDKDALTPLQKCIGCYKGGCQAEGCDCELGYYDTMFGLDRARNSSRKLDLLAISHFHADHINGVVELLKGFECRVLLLPLIPLAHRVAKIHESGADFDSENGRLLLRPIEAISGKFKEAGVKVDRIIAVVPSNHPPSEENEKEIKAVDLVEHGFPKVKPKEDSVESNSVDGLRHQSGYYDKEVEVEVLEAGLSLRAARGFEFVPYNPVKVNKDDSFVTEVNGLADDLMDEKTCEKALIHLENRYEELKRPNLRNPQKETAVDPNEISMMLYSGVIENRTLRRRVSVRNSRRGRVRSQKDGVLNTGDSYLKTPTQYCHMSEYFGSYRMNNLSVFQANHHGSKANWHAGLAKKLKADEVVFCSEVGYRSDWEHPHPEVVADFSGVSLCIQVGLARPHFVAGICWDDL